MSKLGIEVRELSLEEVERVAGGVDGTGNYKFCANGPAGTGVYPSSVDCDTPTWGQIFESWAALGRKLGGRA